MRRVPWLRHQSTTTLLVTAGVVCAALAQVAIAGEALWRARLGHEITDTPIRFYARPTVLYPGARVDTDRLGQTLHDLGYRAVRSSRVDVGEFARRGRIWTVGRRGFRAPGHLDSGGVAVLTLDYNDRVRGIRDARGHRLPYFSLEPQLLHSPARSTHVDRIPVRLADVPSSLIAAVLTVEDQRFYQHRGVDVSRIVGATVANVKAGRVVQGASTITQQLVKNRFLSSRRTPVRKVREAAMAAVLERRHSKDEILEAYLNQIYLAQDGAYAIHGVGRASQFFFGKDVSQLDLAESALLAGIIKGPSLYSPVRHPEAARARRNLVLGLLRDRELISAEAFEGAVEAPLRLRERSARTRRGRYFVDYVAAELLASQGANALQTGLSVFTTLDLTLQRAAEDAVQEGLERLERAYPRLRAEGVPLQAALVALNPHTGEILAMVGGRDYAESQYNRAVHARRQPGSAFKPIVAVAALSGKSGFTLATPLADEPLAVETPAGLWQPANYDGQFRGRVSFREALERSLNVPLARVGLEVGPERIVSTARSLGVRGTLQPVPSLALGSSEVSPFDLTRAFGVLAAEGYRANAQTTLAVLGPYGEVVSQFERDGERVIGAAAAYLVTSALEGAVNRGTGRGLRSMGYRGPLAAKSGTTNEYRDAWFIGYTPNLAIGVWVGFDDGRSVGLPGSGAALPIFGRFLLGAVGRYGDGDFYPPRDIEVVEIDPHTGLRAGPGCRGEAEVFLPGTAPEESCAPYWASSRDGRRGWSGFERDLRRFFEGLRRRLERN